MEADTGKGVLYLVSTPIGNLEDITLRALNTLKAVDVIAAEDTRHTAKLLAHYGISTRLVSCHEHNENERAEEFAGRLMGGASIAFVSDAGTPSVSDPGFRLVSTLIAKGLDVVPIPGVSAAVAALSVSGLPTDSFVFVGFLSRKKGKRLEQISGLVQEKRTIIFYESPKRVVNFIEEVMGVFGDRNGMLAREMTKIHEEFIRGSLTDILAVLRGKESVKGECTVIVAGADDPGPPDGSIESEIRERLLKGDEGPSILAKDISVKYGVRKNDVYAEILRIRSGQDPKTPSD